MWELGSQYLLGPDLLVAPVTRAGGHHWPLYLPAGEWYDFWTHERLDGGRGVSVARPPGVAPLLVREAAPCSPAGRSSSAPTSAPWTS